MAISLGIYPTFSDKPICSTRHETRWMFFCGALKIISPSPLRSYEARAHWPWRVNPWISWMLGCQGCSSDSWDGMKPVTPTPCIKTNHRKRKVWWFGLNLWKEKKSMRLHVVSGKRLHNYGKSPFFMGKLSINGDFPCLKSMEGLMVDLLRNGLARWLWRPVLLAANGRRLWRFPRWSRACTWKYITQVFLNIINPYGSKYLLRKCLGYNLL